MSHKLQSGDICRIIDMTDASRRNTSIKIGDLVEVLITRPTEDIITVKYKAINGEFYQQIFHSDSLEYVCPLNPDLNINLLEITSI